MKLDFAVYNYRWLTIYITKRHVLGQFNDAG